MLNAAANSRRFVAAVSDFGLSRIVGSGGRHTQTVGTVTHQPPELLADGLLTRDADVYAWGCLLWSVSRLFCGGRGGVPREGACPPARPLVSPRSKVLVSSLCERTPARPRHPHLQMYCGEPPFSGQPAAVIIHQVVSSSRCPLQLPPSAPAGLRVRACMVLL